MSVYSEPEEWVKEAVNSILLQSFSDFELLIFNDDPENAANLELILNYCEQDNRVKLFKNIENKGLVRNLNMGIKKSKGEFIARMDADDISHPERLGAQYNYMKSHPDVSVCGSYMKFFGEKNHLHKFPINNDDIYAELMYCNVVCHPSVMIRKSTLVDNGIKYNENFKTSQDYELWSQLVFRFSFHNMNLPLLSYRVSKSQISSKLKINQRKNSQLVRSYLICRALEEKYDLTLKKNNISYIIGYLCKRPISKMNSNILLVLVASASAKMVNISTLFCYIFSRHFHHLGKKKRIKLILHLLRIRKMSETIQTDIL